MFRISGAGAVFFPIRSMCPTIVALAGHLKSIRCAFFSANVHFIKLPSACVCVCVCCVFVFVCVCVCLNYLPSVLNHLPRLALRHPPVIEHNFLSNNITHNIDYFYCYKIQLLTIIDIVNIVIVEPFVIEHYFHQILTLNLTLITFLVIAETPCY